MSIKSFVYLKKYYCEVILLCNLKKNKKMKELEKANMLLAEVREILAEHDWVVSNPLFFGLLDSYPEDIINAAINHVALFIEDCGDYFIDNAGLIRTKLNCNWFVAAYDGCTPEEMQGDYTAMIMGY